MLNVSKLTGVFVLGFSYMFALIGWAMKEAGANVEYASFLYEWLFFGIATLLLPLLFSVDWIFGNLYESFGNPKRKALYVYGSKTTEFFVTLGIVNFLNLIIKPFWCSSLIEIIFAALLFLYVDLLGTKTIRYIMVKALHRSKNKEVGGR